jgi:cytochrome c553
VSQIRSGTLHAVILGLAAVVGANALTAEPAIKDKVKLCATCHGENGVPINKTTPVIWGQNEGYLYLQLRDFKSGTRKNEQMGPIAAELSKDEMYALAAHFTKLKWPDLQQPRAPRDVAKEATQTNRSVGCTGCHLKHYQGHRTTPRLAGQWREYLETTMKNFRDGTRGNNPGMTNLMKATSTDQIEALAQYLAGLKIESYLRKGR